MGYRSGALGGKAISVVGLVFGVLFVILGVAVLIPSFGLPGIVWVAMAGILTAYYAHDVFSRGVPAYGVNVDTRHRLANLDDALCQLAQLRQEGLLSEQEYEQRRAELLRLR